MQPHTSPRRSSGLRLLIACLALFGTMQFPIVAGAQDATPEVPILDGTPADATAIQAVEEALATLLASLDDPATVSSLVTDNLVQQVGGYETTADALEGGFFDNLTFNEFEIGDISTFDDGRTSAEVQYWTSPYQVIAETWYFVDEAGTLKIDSSTPDHADIEGDTAAVGVAISLGEEGAITVAPNAPTVVEPEILILQATNTAEIDLTFAVVLLPEEGEAAGLLDGSVELDSLEFVGSIEATADGEPHELTLVALPTGSYGLLAFDPTSEELVAASDFAVAALEL